MRLNSWGAMMLSRGVFVGLAGLLALAGGVHASGVGYFVLRPTPALQKGVATPVAPAISLRPGILPEGMDGKPYSFDLKSLAMVTAGPGISAAQFAVSGGALPSGIALSSEGLLAGTPIGVTSPEGAGFTVMGTYMTATGQQTYSIKVGESVLQVTQIAAGSMHTCATTLTGAAVCWGQNPYGQLGNGTTSTSTVPVQVVGLTSGVTNISSLGDFTCAVRAGAALCWGFGLGGVLGNGSTSNSAVPVQVSGLTSGVSQVSSGIAQACALKSDGAVSCWGGNTAGQLGDGTTTGSATPVQVQGMTSGVKLVGSGNAFVCALKTSGAVSCWGYGAEGQLGNGGVLSSGTPVGVVGLSSATGLAVGGAHACAIVSGGALWCWGLNSRGMLGNGATSNSSTPVQASALPAGVSHVALNAENTCAIVSGAVWCIGYNGYGQLGNGSMSPSAVPVQVSGLVSASKGLSVGYNHVCAFNASGAAKCWGRNSGRLGNGATAQSSTPVSVKRGAGG